MNHGNSEWKRRETEKGGLRGKSAERRRKRGREREGELRSSDVRTWWRCDRQDVGERKSRRHGVRWTREGNASS